MYNKIILFLVSSFLLVSSSVFAVGLVEGAAKDMVKDAVTSKVKDAASSAVGNTTGGSLGKGGTEAGSLIDADYGPLCMATGSTETKSKSGLAVSYRDGQSFVSWRDRAEGEAGQSYRYRVYRSSEQIKNDGDLATAEMIADRVLNNSGQLFGYGFQAPGRIDPTKPMTPIIEGGDPLPLWSGLQVASVQANGCGYYAVIATDTNGVAVESVEPGVNATVEPVAEKVLPKIPIKALDSKDRIGPYVSSTSITNTPNLPMMVILHGSNAGGGTVPGGEYGDYYVYYGDRSMAHQEGVPGIFTVSETHSANPRLTLRSRDTVIDPFGANPRSVETRWFGYVAEKLTTGERFAYPFTEIRQDWIVKWAIEKYSADPNRIVVRGDSMGAWGTMSYALRRPDMFSAVYPDRPKMRHDSIASLGTDSAGATLQSGGSWQDQKDAILFVKNHPGDLPFVGWNIGRRDGYADWGPQVEMVKALTEGKHGFAFVWNNGDHGTGAPIRDVIFRWYPTTKFARNESYPAFSNSSIDDNLGSGNPIDGDLEGGINLGFDWSVTADTQDRWEVSVSNALATEEMTVDVTPRRLQSFLPVAGEELSYTESLGASGTITTDTNRLATVEGVRIRPGESTVIVIERK